MIKRVLCFYPGRLELARGAMASIYGLRDGGGVLDHVVLVFFNPLATREDAGRLSERITIVELPQHVGRLGGRPVAFLRAVARLVRRAFVLARSERVEAVVALDPHLLGLTAWLLGRARRLPWAIEVVQDYDVSARQAHGLAFKPFLFPGVERAVERFLFRRAPLVLAMYPHLAEWAISRGARRERVVTIGTVADDCHYASWPDLRGERARVIPGAEGRTWLLYVGRLHPVKFTHDLPAILDVATRQGVDAHLVILGDGPQREALEHEFARRGLAERVSIPGVQSQDSLARWYRMADVLVYTHGGITLIEGALAGTPIVCYRHDWHADLVGESERGWLVPFRDTEAFGEAIASVVKDPAAGRDRAARARDFARATFSRARYRRIQEQVYRRLADEPDFLDIPATFR